MILLEKCERLQRLEYVVRRVSGHSLVLSTDTDVSLRATLVREKVTGAIS